MIEFELTRVRRVNARFEEQAHLDGMRVADRRPNRCRVTRRADRLPDGQLVDSGVDRDAAV